MASKIRENQASLARLQRIVDTLKTEAHQPFLATDAQDTLTKAVNLLEVKVSWLSDQIAKEEALQIG